MARRVTGHRIITIPIRSILADAPHLASFCDRTITFLCRFRGCPPRFAPTRGAKLRQDDNRADQQEEHDEFGIHGRLPQNDPACEESLPRVRFCKCEARHIDLTAGSRN